MNSSYYDVTENDKCYRRHVYSLKSLINKYKMNSHERGQDLTREASVLFNIKIRKIR